MQLKKLVKYFLGNDLGQAQDPTAFANVEKVTQYDFQEHRYGSKYKVTHLERPDLGTGYPSIVQRAKVLMSNAYMRMYGQLVIDETGVGRAVRDMMVLAGLDPACISITAGREAHQEVGDKRVWLVPKKELVTTMIALAQAGNLKVVKGLSLASVLVAELENFRVKVGRSGYEQFEAWRETDHDDLLLAVAIAVWWGETQDSTPEIVQGIYRGGDGRSKTEKEYDPLGRKRRGRR